ncbi:hypothetical protein ACFVTY_09090 [Streptomyces sp. NPDC058067]|uniref:hypothetical protein n=1 Tax=Streptomyces sp. NPDC058067 TaxID=3346324 RepID=UPI0036ED6E7E
MVLVRVHALSGTGIRRLLLTELDPRERLIVRRPGKRHIIYLDELTYCCASAWLRERHRRWPVTTNPRLLINQWTAVDTTHSPIGTTFAAIFQPTGLTMPTLRQDRIRYEASEVDDPLHLMRLFGISSHTAMRYITAAHPEREASGSHHPVRRGPACPWAARAGRGGGGVSGRRRRRSSGCRCCRPRCPRA